MIKLIAQLKGVFLLLAVVLVWGLFIFDTYFGYFQLGMVGLCLLFKGVTYPLVFFTRRYAWHNLFMLKFNKIKHQLNSWCFTLWLSNDQYINSVFKGLEDHSISGRVGYLAMQGNKSALVMEKIINLGFFLATGQRNHCREAIEWDEVKLCQK